MAFGEEVFDDLFQFQRCGACGGLEIEEFSLVSIDDQCSDFFWEVGCVRIC